MKNIRSISKYLAFTVVALAMVASATAQQMIQASAKVVRIKGDARFATAANVWQPLKVGDVLSAGAIIQTARDSRVDLVLGEKNAIGATYKKSDWNDYVIIAKGNRIVHYLNGIQTVDITDNDPGTTTRPGRALAGLLALQIHAGPPMWVEFKNVRLKQFDK